MISYLALHKSFTELSACNSTIPDTAVIRSMYWTLLSTQDYQYQDHSPCLLCMEVHAAVRLKIPVCSPPTQGKHANDPSQPDLFSVRHRGGRVGLDSVPKPNSCMLGVAMESEKED